MDVILLEDVKKLGKIGDLVSVSDGYARNFLIPKNLATTATKRNIKELEHKKRVAEAKAKRDLAKAENMAAKLESLKITIPANVGEDDKLFGSITNRDIAEAMTREGVEIDRKNIILEEPIKAAGVFDVDVKVHKDVIAKVRVWVVKE